MTAYSPCDIAALGAQVRRGLRFLIIAGLSSLSMAPMAIGAAAAPTPSVSESEAARVVAAAPMRELNRAWSQCIDEVLFIAKNNAEADVARIESLVSFSCEGYESRLTGELIKRYGYDRGGAIIAALKRKNRARYEAVAKAVTAKPKGFVVQTGDWAILRMQAGSCVAIIRNHAFTSEHFSWLAMEDGQWRLGFSKSVSYGNKYRAQHGQLANVQLSAFNSMGPIGSVRQQLRFEVASDLIGWSMPMGDTVANELSAANRIQFQALPEEQYVDRVFPIAGIVSAWNEVKKCAATK